MTKQSVQHVCYPLLESLLVQRGLQLKGIYRISDVAKMFGVANRTIQEWVRDMKLCVRDLPGRGRFLSEDLEDFLEKSVRKFDAPTGQANTAKPETLNQSRTSYRRSMGRPR